MTTYVVFIASKDNKLDWFESESVRQARALPGVRVVLDYSGDAERGFHVLTSGTTLLYDRKGTLVFQGGITGSRGHSGDNAGRSAVVALVNGTRVPAAKTAVFGCSLVSPPGI